MRATAPLSAPAFASGCPTALRPVAAKDGLLARLIVPGGRLDASAFASFVRGCRSLGVDGFEITNRANLQMRGLDDARARAVLDLMVENGLLPRRDADRRRAIVTSPLAGRDGTEQADPRALVQRIDAFLLGCDRTAALSAKAGIGVDGNGRWRIVQRSLDLVFVANGPLWQPVLAGVSLDIGLTEDAVPQALEGLLHHLARAGTGRVKTLTTEQRDALVTEMRRLGAGLSTAVSPSAPDRPPVGAIATSDGRFALAAIAPFGVLSGAAALVAADAAAQLGSGDVTLSPWQGLVLPGLDAHGLAKAGRTLAEVGLATDPDTPFALLHACAAGAGCARSDAPVRSIARAVAGMLASRSDRARRIHVSGCARGCAWPRSADLVLQADDKGRYELRRGADARVQGSGRLMATGLDRDQAVEAVRLQLDFADSPE